MGVYDTIRDKIVESGSIEDGPGAEGPKGSFNHKGGKELVIKYEVEPGVHEKHHIVPYLIGKSRTKDDEDDNKDKVRVLLAWKYKGEGNHLKTGFRCYMVDRISLPSSPAPDTRPPRGAGDNDRKKLKLKRQSCVDDW